MLSRNLLRDAVEACSKARAPIGPLFLQRRIRVGWATASQLVDALEAAAVVGPYPVNLTQVKGRLVLVTDAAEGHALVAAAIADGRIQLDIDEDHAFRSVNGAARCVAVIGPLDSGRSCGLPPEAHQRPTTTGSNPAGGGAP